MFNAYFDFSGKTLCGVAFDHKLRSGDRLCVRGDNGSGKTSLLCALAGLSNHPDQPNILRKTQGDLRAESHYIGHRTGIHEELSIAEEWQFWYAIFNPHLTKASCPIAETTHHVGLDIPVQRKINTLSAGQKQKVALARLFLAPRPIWLLDEPDHHLDQTSREMLENWLRQHCQKGGIVIDTSHFPPNFGTVFSVQGED